jgi:hypothetical protein
MESVFTLESNELFYIFKLICSKFRLGPASPCNRRLDDKPTLLKGVNMPTLAAKDFKVLAFHSTEVLRCYSLLGFSSRNNCGRLDSCWRMIALFSIAMQVSAVWR